MAREIRVTVVLNADTNEVTVDGPLDKQELCLAILKSGVNVVNEYNARKLGYVITVPKGN